MPKPLPSLRRSATVIVFSLASLLFIGGCASEAGRRHRDEEDAAPSAAIPEMEAQASFLAGTIEVEVLLNRAGFAPRDGKGSASSADDRGGGGFRGGLRGLGGGFGGGRRGMRGGGEGGESRGGGEPAPHIVASNQPPVALHLRLTNHGSSPIEVEVSDFDSDLGNFVVQPPKITVPPHGSAEADPMTSRLGVMATEIPITVTLRTNGQVENQVLVLHVKSPSAAPSSSTPGANPTP